jgi:hypothetical protein
MQESGVVAIGNLAKQFALGGELLLSVVTARMGSGIQGRLEGGLIFTPAYVARIKAQVYCQHHASSVVWKTRPSMLCCGLWQKGFNSLVNLV